MVWAVCLRHAVAGAGPDGADLQPSGTDRTIQLGTVQLGDVVIVHFRGRPPYQLYAKRVLGLPGDQVEVRHGLILINGVPVQREALPGWPGPGLGGDGQPRIQETLPNGRIYAVLGGWAPHELATVPIQVVPPARAFVVSGNRPNSPDSRLAGVGMIPFDGVAGVVTTGDAALEALRDRLMPTLGGPRLERGL